MKIWKALGLAGLAGVAATGAVIARDQRKRSDLTPEQIKDRLHERLGSPETSEDVIHPGGSSDHNV